MNTLIHTTFRVNMPQILKTGLRYDKRNTRFHNDKTELINELIKKYGEEEKQIERDKCVFLMFEKDVKIADTTKHHDFIQVNVDSLDKSKLFVACNTLISFIYDEYRRNGEITFMIEDAIDTYLEDIYPFDYYVQHYQEIEKPGFPYTYIPEILYFDHISPFKLRKYKKNIKIGRCHNGNDKNK